MDYDIRPALYEYSKAEKLSKTAVKEGKTAKIHIALDTGMSRIGFQPGEASVREVERIHTLPGIRIEGLFTHFSKADESDKDFTELQYRRYMEFNDALKQRGIEIPVRHCANSAAIIDVYKRQMQGRWMRGSLKHVPKSSRNPVLRRLNCRMKCFAA